jgi:hypothetical protein
MDQVPGWDNSDRGLGICGLVHATIDLVGCLQLAGVGIQCQGYFGLEFSLVGVGSYLYLSRGHITNGKKVGKGMGCAHMVRL